MVYRVGICYSGYVEIPVANASSPEEAIILGRAEAERLRNEPEGKFIENLMPTLESWPDADTAEEIK